MSGILAGNACVARPQPENDNLSSVLSMLDDRVQMAGALADRIAVAMDRVSGGQPHPVADPTKATPVPDGMIGALHDRLQVLYRHLDLIDTGVRRLERASN